MDQQLCILLHFADVHSQNSHHRLQRPGSLALAQILRGAHPRAGLIGACRLPCTPGFFLVLLASKGTDLNEPGTTCLARTPKTGAKLELFL